MKKIMFNDRYGLTDAVLEGKKTMTRRSVKWNILCGGREDTICVVAVKELPDGRRVFTTYNTAGNPVGQAVSPYRIGEEVAIAQKYKDCWYIYQERWEAKKDPFDWHTPDAILGDQADRVKGWTNKMFVRADLMPYRILFTDIKAERLQDISEEDCLKEGIQEYFPYIDRNPNDRVRTFQYFRDGKIRYRTSPAPECFARLIDDISGKGTWQRNPWVFAYEFELIK